MNNHGTYNGLIFLHCGLYLPHQALHKRNDFIKYCLTPVEQHQAATYILVALERCCSSDVIVNGQCHSAGEIFLPFETGSRLLDVPL